MIANNSNINVCMPDCVISALPAVGNMSGQAVHKFVGWRYAALIGGMVGMIGLAMYPIFVDPYLHPEKWRKFMW